MYVASKVRTKVSPASYYLCCRSVATAGLYSNAELNGFDERSRLRVATGYVNGTRKDRYLQCTHLLPLRQATHARWVCATRARQVCARTAASPPRDNRQPAKV